MNNPVNLPQNGTPTPVFILGAARSGTKFIRDVLAAPNHVCQTPFDSNHVWRIGNARAPDDLLLPEGLSSRTAAVIRRALWKLAAPGQTSNADQILLEKTVSNALRPDFVERVFPDARYIVLIRDGRDAIESTYRMWQAPPDSGGLKRKLASLPIQATPYALWYGLNLIGGKLRGRGVGIWGVRYKGIQEDLNNLTLPEVCAHQWRNCVETSLGFAQGPNAARVIQLRYEDVIADASSLDPVCEFLQFASNDRMQVKSQLKRTLQPPAASRWHTTFNDDEREKVLRIIEPLQKQLGYPVG